MKGQQTLYYVLLFSLAFLSLFLPCLILQWHIVCSYCLPSPFLAFSLLIALILILKVTARSCLHTQQDDVSFVRSVIQKLIYQIPMLNFWKRKRNVFFLLGGPENETSQLTGNTSGCNFVALILLMLVWVLWDRDQIRRQEVRFLISCILFNLLLICLLHQFMMNSMYS